MDEQVKKLLGVLLAKVNRNELLVASVANVISEYSVILYELLQRSQKCEIETCDQLSTTLDPENNNKICDKCSAIKIVSMKLDENSFIDLNNAHAIRAITVLASAVQDHSSQEIIH